jgi:hypothetical protein
MATIQINSTDWENRITVRKGNLGEAIVKRFLEGKSFVCYKSITDKAHAFDFLAVKDKKDFIIAEVKSKALMNVKPVTGINYRNLEEYKYVLDKYKIPIFLFFVDEHLKEIYGNWLHILEKRVEIGNEIYPQEMTTKKGILLRLWHYKQMRHIAKISDSQANDLKTMSSRKYEYEINI